MKRIFLLLLFALPAITVQSQNLFTTTTQSHYTYIFQISDEEAKEVYTTPYWQIPKSLFHTLVDSFPTGEKYTKRLPQGNYLQVYTDQAEVKASVTTVAPFEVFILNNQTDLMIQVRDSLGQVVNDAEVQLKNRTLKFDQASQSYRIGKSNQNGFLEVKYAGMSVYQVLKKRYKNSRSKRIYSAILRSRPVRYIWRPVRFWVGLPIDAVRSAVKGRKVGSIYNATTFPRRTFYWGKRTGKRFLCLFNDDHCRDRDYKVIYFTTNKPKYRQQDTVKCKVYLVKGSKAKELKDELSVTVLENNRKKITTFKIKPDRKKGGGYSFQIVLSDSLKLTLDKSYAIQLKDAKGRTVALTNFKYEDYELKSVALTFRADGKKHFAGKPFKFYAKATNENNLVLKDGSIRY